jgi:hypothetical protein
MSESPPQSDRENPTSNGEEFSLEEFFVAPWGLANEERPLHLLWKGEIRVLELRFAEPVELIDGYNISRNITDFTEDLPEGEDNYRLLRICQSDLLVPGYFNTKFIVPEIFENAMTGQPIQAKFILENGETKELNSQTFTIRPQLKLLDSPQERHC